MTINWDGFFSDWRSLRLAILYWLQGGDPYGSYPTLNGGFYDAGYFAYPPPVLLLATPLALLPWWLSGLLLQAVAIVLFEAWARRTTNRSALIWVFLWPPLMQGLYIGQTTLFFLAAMLVAERAMAQRRDTLAGALLALTLLKPQVGMLAVVFLLAVSLWTRRWVLLGAFTFTSIVLWGGTFLILGGEIYSQWWYGINAYRYALPDQPLLTLPLGVLLILLSFLLWRKNSSDGFGLALLSNTLIYPLSVLYIISPLAAVVMRWRHDWQWWALMLCWTVPILFSILAANHQILAWHIQIQALAAFTLLVGLLPQMALVPDPTGRK